MEKWLEPLGNRKQRLRCEACKEYSYSVFFLWYTHPSISSFYTRDPLTICTRCCKREAGVEYYKKKIKEYNISER